MAILSKECKLDIFEPYNFRNIWALCFNFVEFESSLESNSPEILALCETNLNNSTDSCNFWVKGYLPLIQKDFITHMHGLAVYVKERLPFAWGLSLENSSDSYLTFSTGFTPLSVLLLFPLSVTFFVVMNNFWFYFF